MYLIGAMFLLFLIVPALLIAIVVASGAVTTVESGNMKYVVKGESYRKLLYETPGEKLEVVDHNLKEGTFVPKSDGRTPTYDPIDAFLYRIFGRRFVGMPFVANVHRFPIQKRRPNLLGDGPSEWVEIDPEVTWVDSLRETIVVPYALDKVELKGGELAIRALLIATFEVVKPYLPVFTYKGEFFLPAGGIVEAGFSDALRKMDFQQFTEAQSSQTGNMMLALIDPDGPLNKVLIEKIGLRLKGLEMPKWDPANEDTRQAVDAAALAARMAKAQVAEAEGYKQSVAIRTDADVSRIEQIAEARRKEITATREALTEKGADPNLVTQETSRLLQREEITKSHVTTLVEGGGTQTPIAIQPQPTKKEEEKE